MDSDIEVQKPEQEIARVRVERTLKFVSRDVQNAYKAVGGSDLSILGIDPDTPTGELARLTIKQWAASREGIFGYLAQWGLLEKEVVVIHIVKVFVDGQLVHTAELDQL